MKDCYVDENLKLKWKKFCWKIIGKFKIAGFQNNDRWCHGVGNNYIMTVKDKIRIKKF